MTRPKPIAASVIIPVYTAPTILRSSLMPSQPKPVTPVLRCSFVITAVPTALALWSKATMPPYPLRVIDASQRGGASHARNMGGGYKPQVISSSSAMAMIL